MKRIYGLSERQFRNTFERVTGEPGVTGTNLLVALETRLDNLVYRMGFAASRKAARQLVRHGHIEVNGRRVDIPSYRVQPGEEVRVAPASRELVPVKLAQESAAPRRSRCRGSRWTPRRPPAGSPSARPASDPDQRPGTAHRRALLEVTMTIDLTGLVRPHLVEMTKREDNPNVAEFRLQPLERGFGYTLGNSLRRLLLSSLRGSAVWAFRLDGVVHEHQTVQGVLEDVHQIIQRLKALTLVLGRGRRRGRAAHPPRGRRAGVRPRHPGARLGARREPRPAAVHAAGRPRRDAWSST